MPETNRDRIVQHLEANGLRVGRDVTVRHLRRIDEVCVNVKTKDVSVSHVLRVVNSLDPALSTLVSVGFTPAMLRMRTDRVWDSLGRLTASGTPGEILGTRYSIALNSGGSWEATPSDDSGVKITWGPSVSAVKVSRVLAENLIEITF